MKKLTLLLLFAPIYIFAQSQQDDVYGKQNTKEVRVKDSTYNAGVEAAKTYYKGYEGPASATLIVSIISPILGLAPAVGTTTGTPNDIMHPGSDYLKIPQYYLGYTDTAKKLRSRKVWGKWALGSGISIGITLAIIAIIKSNNKQTVNSYKPIPQF